MHLVNETTSTSLENTWSFMYHHGSPSDTEELHSHVLDVIVLADQAIEALKERVAQLESQLQDTTAKVDL